MAIRAYGDDMLVIEVGTGQLRVKVAVKRRDQLIRAPQRYTVMLRESLVERYRIKILHMNEFVYQQGMLMRCPLTCAFQHLPRTKTQPDVDVIGT